MNKTPPAAPAQDEPRHEPDGADFLLIGFGLAYLALPIDLITDFFHGIGRLDDLAVLAWTGLVLRGRFLRAAPFRRAGLLASALVTLLVTNYVAFSYSPPAWFYDWCYKVGAPWDRIGLDPDITGLIKSRLDGKVPPSARAIDLGSGSGAYTIFLAKLGFRATGVDFSKVALQRAGKSAAAQGVAGRTEFLFGDLTAPDLPGVEGPFDLLLDVSTLDDLAPADRRAMAAHAAALARPGALFVTCAHVKEPSLGMQWVDFITLSGISQLRPGEMERLYGDTFEIVPPRRLEPDHNNVCYLLTRKAAGGSSPAGSAPPAAAGAAFKY